MCVRVCARARVRVLVFTCVFVFMRVRVCVSHIIIHIRMCIWIHKPGDEPGSVCGCGKCGPART